MMRVDALICAHWVVPVEPANTVLCDHAVAVVNGRIVGLCPTSEANTRFAPEKIVKLPPQHVLIPGLVNLHTHAAMALMRGCGDDLPLMRWLEEKIWPIENALMSAEFVRDGTRFACLEMLQGGVTCFSDMYFFQDAAAEAVLETGIRAVLGAVVIEFPSAWAQDPKGYITKGLQVRDRFLGESRLHFALAPHAPYTVSDASFLEINTLAEQLDLPIHLHIHETEDEIQGSLRQYGVRPIERLAQLGLLSPRLIGVHAVHLNADEIGQLALHGVHLAHCPTSNLKLGSGIAPIAECLSAGIPIGIGTDGAASNNRLDLFSEMRLAALLAKGRSGNPFVWPAHTVLESATLSGARALGLAGQIGSIAIGKLADLVAVNLNKHHHQPVFDPVSHLVHVAAREDVSDVWVHGRHVVASQQFTNASLQCLSSSMNSCQALWHNRVGALL